jgi:hypothetical protein
VEGKDVAMTKEEAILRIRRAREELIAADEACFRSKKPNYIFANWRKIAFARWIWVCIEFARRND